MRSDSTGVVYRRPGSPFWWAGYYQNGKRVRVSTHEIDEKRANDWLRRRMAKVLLGSTPEPSALTVKGALDLVLGDYEAKGNRSTENVRYKIRHLLGWWGPAHRIDAIMPESAVRYVRDRKADGGSHNSIRAEVHLLSRGIKLAVRSRLLDPAAVPYLPQLPYDESTSRRDFVSQAELEQICAHLEPDLADFVRFLFFTGWRRSEVDGLTWTDYDPEGPALRLWPERSKTNEPRIVPIAGPLVPVMERRLAQRLKNVRWIFWVRRGATVHKIGDVRKAMARACEAAGVAPIRLHALRRSAAKYWVELGADRNRVMALLGHRTDAMFRRYQIVDAAALRDVLERGLPPGKGENGKRGAGTC